MPGKTPRNEPTTRIQYEEDARGKKTFRGYSINGQNGIEHIEDLEKAIERAKMLRRDGDVTALQAFTHNP